MQSIHIQKVVVQHSIVAQCMFMKNYSRFNCFLCILVFIIFSFSFVSYEAIRGCTYYFGLDFFFRSDCSVAWRRQRL